MTRNRNLFQTSVFVVCFVAILFPWVNAAKADERIFGQLRSSLGHIDGYVEREIFISCNGRRYSDISMFKKLKYNPCKRAKKGPDLEKQPNYRPFTLPAAAGSDTLENVKSRGQLLCGITVGVKDFASFSVGSRHDGFDMDVCRAVAAAVLGDASKVKFVPLTGRMRFPTLQSGEIDLLARGKVPSFDKAVNLDYEFTAINFYDGQGFIVRRNLGIRDINELDGVSICMVGGSSTELSIGDFFRDNNIDYTPVIYDRADEAFTGYAADRCDAYVSYRSSLAELRSALPSPDDHKILPGVISKEPFGPLVRHGDIQWKDIVRWTVNIMLIAEDKGITSDNVDKILRTTEDLETRRLLGLEGEYGNKLGLRNDFAVNVIRQVGNYAESYDRNIGPNSPISLSRGINQLWSNGGILYSPPFR